MSAHGHFEYQCQFGRRHGGCRCMSPDKLIHAIVCTTPERCAPTEENSNMTEDDNTVSIAQVLHEAKESGNLVTIMLASGATILVYVHAVSATHVETRDAVNPSRKGVFRLSIIEGVVERPPTG